MLTLTGNGKTQTCDGVTRRDFMQVGSLGALGVGLPHYLAAKERGAIPADWDNSEIRELARTAPAVAEKLVSAFTGGATVRVGEPAGQQAMQSL